MPTATKHATQNANQYADLRDTLERHVFLPPATVTPAFLFAEFADRPSLPVHLGIRRDGIRVLEMAGRHQQRWRIGDFECYGDLTPTIPNHGQASLGVSEGKIYVQSLNDPSNLPL
jgi:hypothetical protein